MKVLILTDTHNYEYAARAHYLVERPDFVLDCGDHTSLENMFEFTPHWYVEGNHEPEFIVSRANELPLPHKIPSGQVVALEKDGEVLRVAGLDGHYSRGSPHSVSLSSIKQLSRMPVDSVDVLLVHESPLDGLQTDREHASLVIHDIDRLRPRFVFAGHYGEFNRDKTPGGIPVVRLLDTQKGYGVLNVRHGRLNFENKRAVYGRAGPPSKH
jgi:predicted phosphodiesterase